MVNRTPTETLMAAMEEFGKDEPINCVLVFQTMGGDICTMASTDAISIKVGLLETAKHLQLGNIARE